MPGKRADQYEKYTDIADDDELVFWRFAAQDIGNMRGETFIAWLRELIPGSATMIYLPKLSSPPADPVPGMIVMADRVTWDPLGLGSGGAYLTMYLGANTGWGAITAQMDVEEA